MPRRRASRRCRSPRHRWRRPSARASSAAKMTLQEKVAELFLERFRSFESIVLDDLAGLEMLVVVSLSDCSGGPTAASASRGGDARRRRGLMVVPSRFTEGRDGREGPVSNPAGRPHLPGCHRKRVHEVTRGPLPLIGFPARKRTAKSSGTVMYRACQLVISAWVHAPRRVLVPLFLASSWSLRARPPADGSRSWCVPRPFGARSSLASSAPPGS